MAARRWWRNVASMAKSKNINVMAIMTSAMKYQWQHQIWRQ